MSQIYKATVSQVNALPNREGKDPAWDILLEGSTLHVFSLLPTSQGDEIFYEERTNSRGPYGMRMAKDGDNWVIAKPESSSSSSKGSKWERRVAPLTPQAAVSIYAQCFVEMQLSGLSQVLTSAGYDPMTALSTVFIAATRAQDPYEGHDTTHPPAGLILQALENGENSLSSLDSDEQVDETEGDILDEL